MCFIAMPFGKKAPLGKDKPVIDFDKIHEVIHDAVEGAGLESKRADFEESGGFIHKAMFERLLLAEYVVADLTFANPNVTYEIGVRHGANAGMTLLICGRGESLDQLPFDFAPLRALPYDLDENGVLSQAAAATLSAELGKRLRLARSGELPSDNPIMQITAYGSSARVEHQKTDLFLHRIEFASDIGTQVAEAIQNPDTDEAIKTLVSLEDEVCAGPDTVAQLHTALLSIYLAYREKKAYDRMTALFERLPTELKRTQVAREQLALALNRLAEHSAKDGDRDQATRYRNKAIATIEEISEDERSSETFGILGRIYKGHFDAESNRGNEDMAQAMLRRAIDSYEAGFRQDPRDYYPGVNAVTLRLRRGDKSDFEALQKLIPVVRFAVERAPKPKDDMERYWQCATKLQLASADRDWTAAQDLSIDLIGIPAHDWMRETTVENFKIQREALQDDPKAVAQLDKLIGKLTSA
jgi:tetratricopeptide (TPR) repeat protein